MKMVSPSLLTFLSQGNAPAWSTDVYSFFVSDYVNTGSYPQGSTSNILNCCDPSLPGVYPTDWPFNQFGPVPPWGDNVPTFYPVGAVIKRSSWQLKNTCDTTEMDITIMPSEALPCINGVSLTNFLSLLEQGAFDGVGVWLLRAFFLSAPPKPSYWNGQPPAGPGMSSAILSADAVVPIFSGNVADIEITDLGARLRCVSANSILQQVIPKDTFQTSCTHLFCDTGCTLNINNFKTTMVVGANPTNTFIPWAAGAIPANPAVYNMGHVYLNPLTDIGPAGAVATIQSADATGLYLIYPMLTPVTTGQTLTIVQGCDKTLTRCQALNNANNFLGFPFIPQNELGY